MATPDNEPDKDRIFGKILRSIGRNVILTVRDKIEAEGEIHGILSESVILYMEGETEWILISEITAIRDA